MLVEHPPPFPGPLALHTRPSPVQGSRGQRHVAGVLGTPAASQCLPVETWVPTLADRAPVLQAAVVWGSLPPRPQPRASGSSQASARPAPHAQAGPWPPGAPAGSGESRETILSVSTTVSPFTSVGLQGEPGNRNTRVRGNEIAEGVSS